jgi:hypothetical protein
VPAAVCGYHGEYPVRSGSGRLVVVGAARHRLCSTPMILSLARPDWSSLGRAVRWTASPKPKTDEREISTRLAIAMTASHQNESTRRD